MSIMNILISTCAPQIQAMTHDLKRTLGRATLQVHFLTTESREVVKVFDRESLGMETPC